MTNRKYLDLTINISDKEIIIKDSMMLSSATLDLYICIKVYPLDDEDNTDTALMKTHEKLMVMVINDPHFRATKYGGDTRWSINPDFFAFPQMVAVPDTFM